MAASYLRPCFAKLFGIAVVDEAGVAKVRTTLGSRTEEALRALPRLWRLQSYSREPSRRLGPQTGLSLPAQVSNVLELEAGAAQEYGPHVGLQNFCFPVRPASGVAARIVCPAGVYSRK